MKNTYIKPIPFDLKMDPDRAYVEKLLLYNVEAFINQVYIPDEKLETLVGDTLMRQDGFELTYKLTPSELKEADTLLIRQAAITRKFYELVSNEIEDVEARKLTKVEKVISTKAGLRFADALPGVVFRPVRGQLVKMDHYKDLYQEAINTAMVEDADREHTVNELAEYSTTPYFYMCRAALLVFNFLTNWNSHLTGSTVQYYELSC